MAKAKTKDAVSAPSKKKREKKKEVVIVIDRSGSMSGQEKEVNGGLKTFIDEQKEHNPKTKVTLAQFDDRYDLLHSSVPLSKVEFDHKPRGMTALLDAVGKTASEAHERFLKYITYPDVLMVIITDGYENASQEFTRQSLKVLMDNLKSEYDWDDLFIGAKFDDFADAHSFGTQTISTAGAKNMNTAFANVSAYYVGTRTMGMSISETKAQFKDSTEADEEMDIGKISTQS